MRGRLCLWCTTAWAEDTGARSVRPGDTAINGVVEAPGESVGGVRGRAKGGVERGGDGADGGADGGSRAGWVVGCSMYVSVTYYRPQIMKRLVVDGALSSRFGTEARAKTGE